MTTHTVTVAALTDGRWQAQCSCGDVGARTLDQAYAELQARLHREYIAEVRAMVEGQEAAG